MGKDFWGMWFLFILFIIFAAAGSAWGGYPNFAIFWLIAGVVGTLVLAYFFRRDARRADK